MSDARDRSDPVPSDDHGVVTRLSPWSVEDSVSRLSALVADKGMKLFAVADGPRTKVSRTDCSRVRYGIDSELAAPLRASTH